MEGGIESSFHLAFGSEAVCGFPLEGDEVEFFASDFTRCESVEESTC
jgi:hypothetical protein